MDLFSVFVTGANRGLGLGFVKHLIQLPKPPAFIFATYRSKGKALQVLKDIRDKSKETKIILIKMDVTQKNTIEAAMKITEDMVGDKGLTLLINNAGVLVSQIFPQITEENLLCHFKTNVMGPIMVVQEFLPLLQRAAALHGSDSKMGLNRATVLNISSYLGSIHDAEKYFHEDDSESHGYNISKASLNMAMRIIAADVKKDGILVIMMCPGWVKTDMGTDKADLEIEESVSAIFDTLSTMDDSHHGLLSDRNGQPYEF